MSTGSLLLLIALALFIGALPVWPYSKSWGYKPTSVLTILLMIFILWAIVGERPLFKRSLGDDIRSAGHDIADSVDRAAR